MSGRVRKFGIYFFMEGLQKASAILLIPIYTAYMNPEQFGILSTCMSISAIAPVLLFLNIYEAAYFVLIKKEQDAWQKVSTAVLVEIAVALAVILAVLSIGSFVPEGRVLFGINWQPYGFYTLIMSALAVFPLTVNQILLASERVKEYAIFTFSSFVLTVSLILVLLVRFNMGAMSFIVGNIVVYFIVMLLVAGFLLCRRGRLFKAEEAGKMLRFSGPLVPHNMAHWARAWSDRLLLATFVSPASTGIFHIAVNYGNILLFGVEAFRNSNNPRFFKLIADVDREQERLTSMLGLSLGVFSLVALVLGTFAQEIIALLTSRDFHDSFLYVPLVLSANLCYLVYINTVNVLFHHSRTGLVSTVTLISATVSVSLGALLIGRFGIAGAAVSTLASNLVMASLVFYQCQKMKKLPWPFAKAILMALFPLILFVVALPSPALKVLFVGVMAAVIALLVWGDARRVGLWQLLPGRG